MAPYDPPCTHYTHLKVDLYTDDMIYAFMGKGGKRFYQITSNLGLRYLWYNTELKVIEIWGSFESLKKDPALVINRKLGNFVENVYFSSLGLNKNTILPSKL